MVRRKIKGTKVRRTIPPSEEPNFYAITGETADPPTPELSPEKIPSANIKSSSSSKTNVCDILPDPDVTLFEGKPLFLLDSLEDDKLIAHDHGGAVVAI